MRLDRLAAGIRIFEDEEVYLDLKMEQYEDIFYAIPLDNQSMFMLLNDTVLKEADDRAILSFIIEANGGVETAMARLQDLVKVLDPKEGEGVKVDSTVMKAAPETAKAEPFTIDDVDQPESVESLPMEEDEPFEAVIQPTPKTPAAMPRPPVAPTPRTPAAMPTPKTPAAMPTPKTPAGMPTPQTPRPAAGGGSPGTRRFEMKKVSPVEIVFNETGKRVKIKCGAQTIDIDVVRYEDLFFACPGDNATIFRLLNDTIINRTEERDALKDILGLLGGLDSGMTALQEAVQKAEPPKRQASRAPMIAGQKKPASVAPGVRPSQPPMMRPTAGGGGMAKAPVASPLSKPGMAPAAKGPVPAPGPKPPAGPRPFTVKEDEVELVDDVEELPVAPVVTSGPGAVPVARSPASVAGKPVAPLQPGAKPGAVPAGGPVSGVKPGVAPPVAGAKPPMAGAPSNLGMSAAQRRKKPIERPAGQADVKMTKEDVERTGVKIKAVPGGVGFQIICREYYIQLSKTQYQELHYALPMAVMNMFKLIHNDLLKDAQSRGVLMKMIHLAGGPKDFMAALSVQVQAIKPTENWQ